jgi:5-methyltetrahydrofolate--homocysteine methyltransferase
MSGDGLMKTTKKGDLFRSLLKEKILFLDGAMGTMIQTYKLDEAAFRGEKFKNHNKPLQGNNDILNLTNPQIITEIHEAFLEAGAHIIETNTFNGTAYSQRIMAQRNMYMRLTGPPRQMLRKPVKNLTPPTTPGL